MAQSRRDKTRKQKLLNYKQKSKKMAKLPETKPFTQIPVWDSNATFEINGAELEAIYNFTNIFAPVFGAVQQIFGRGVQSGKIKIQYQYEDGSPVSQDELSDYTKKLQEYFSQRQAEEDASKETAEDTAPKSKLVSLTGEPLVSEETEA